MRDVEKTNCKISGEISFRRFFFLPFWDITYISSAFQFCRQISIMLSNMNNRVFIPSSRSFILLWEYRMNGTCLPGIYDSPMLRAFYFTATWRSTVSYGSAVNSQRYLNWRCMAFNMIMTSVLYGCSCASENRHFPADDCWESSGFERTLERINTNTRLSNKKKIIGNQQYFTEQRRFRIVGILRTSMRSVCHLRAQIWVGYYDA